MVGRAGRGGRSGQTEAGGRLQDKRVRTDPERVDTVLMMLSQLLTRVTGSEPGPAGHSSLLGIA